MVISGWDILLIFGADQAIIQTLTLYPPFILATITVLTVVSNIQFSGTSFNLRRYIHKYALGPIGRADMENELQKTVTKITMKSENLMTDTKEPIELDAMGLKKYVDFVVREAKRENNNQSRISVRLTREITLLIQI